MKSIQQFTAIIKREEDNTWSRPPRLQPHSLSSGFSFDDDLLDKLLALSLELAEKEKTTKLS